MVGIAFLAACHASATQSAATAGATAPPPASAISPAHDSLFKRLHVDPSRVKVAYLRSDDPSSPYPLDGSAPDGVVSLDTSRPQDKAALRWYLVPGDSAVSSSDSAALSDYLIVTVDGPPRAMDASRADGRVALSPDIDPDNVALRWTFVLTQHGAYQIQSAATQAVLDAGGTDKRPYLNKQSNPADGFQRWRIEFK